MLLAELGWSEQSRGGGILLAHVWNPRDGGRNLCVPSILAAPRALASSWLPRLPLTSVHGPAPWKGHWKGIGYCQGGGQGQASLEALRLGSRLGVGVGGKPLCPRLPLVPTSACLSFLQQRLLPIQMGSL